MLRVLFWYYFNLLHLFLFIQDYKSESGEHINGVYHFSLLGCLNRLNALSLQNARAIECMEALHKYAYRLCYSVEIFFLLENNL